MCGSPLEGGSTPHQEHESPLDAEPASPARSTGLTLRIEGVPWEALAYLALIAVAVGMRLWDLGGRAYHYDETIHAFDSWALFQGNGYIHSPWSHGPFLYEVGAAGFFLFGDNLLAPRIFPALFGVALVAMPLLLRNYLGRGGALATAAILAFSPSLLYFSRFDRADIFTLVFDLGVVIALWRFIEGRRTRYLYLAAVFLALSFSSKETAYLSLVAVGSFLAAWWVRSWLPILWSRASGKMARLRVRLTPSRFPAHGAFLLLMVALTLPLFSSALGVLVDYFPGDLDLVNLKETDPAGRVGAPIGGAGAYIGAGIITGAVFIAAAVIGVLWRPRTFLIAFGAFYAIFFLLHTTFLTNMVGMGTGVWQSLGYWIAQQPVERAGQPWYYYFMQLSLYEFLPFTFGIAAVFAYAIKRGLRFGFWAVVIGVVAGGLFALIYKTTGNTALYAPLAVGLLAVTYLALARGNPFEWFLVHWALVTVLMYVAAGEKMPWLVIHMTLPLALLAGRFIGRMLETLPWRAAFRRGGVALLFAAPLLSLALYALTTSVPWDASPIASWSFSGPLAFTIALMAAGVFLWARVGSAAASRLVAVSVLGLLAFFTVRAGVLLTYENDDNPRELLIYSQVSEEVPQVVDRIAEVARQTGKGRSISILVDTSHAAFAPWRWYLRDYDEVRFEDMTNFTGEIDDDVVLLAAGNDSKISTVRARYGEGQRIPFLQWFNPWVYQNYTPGTFWGDFTSAQSWNRVLRFFTYREMATEPALQDAVAYFSKELS
ncbi:MAG: flippase activity-associated protein Agl23 [Dehalococcoidia bacterium]